VFLLARVLVNVARGLYAVDKLAPHAISALLTAAARSMDPAFGSGQGDDELLDGLAKRIYKGLPRRSRRAFEDAARAYGPAPKPRLDEWMQRVRMTAARAAVIVCDDLSGAVALMRRTEGDLSRLDSSKHKRGMALVGDVMRFAVSDSAISLRRRLGMT
jgi:hypothetical protein